MVQLGMQVTVHSNLRSFYYTRKVPFGKENLFDKVELNLLQIILKKLFTSSI